MIVRYTSETSDDQWLDTAPSLLMDEAATGERRIVQMGRQVHWSDFGLAHIQVALQALNMHQYIILRRKSKAFAMSLG